jgi:hypothetical protein
MDKVVIAKVLMPGKILMVHDHDVAWYCRSIRRDVSRPCTWLYTPDASAGFMGGAILLLLLYRNDAQNRIGTSRGTLWFKEMMRPISHRTPVDPEWFRFMGFWLLLEHLSDVPFVGHCIIERVSCLRVTGTLEVPEPSVALRIV